VTFRRAPTRRQTSDDEVFGYPVDVMSVLAVAISGPVQASELPWLSPLSCAADLSCDVL